MHCQLSQNLWCWNCCALWCFVKGIIQIFAKPSVLIETPSDNPVQTRPSELGQLSKKVFCNFCSSKDRVLSCSFFCFFGWTWNLLPLFNSGLWDSSGVSMLPVAFHHCVKVVLHNIFHIFCLIDQTVVVIHKA